MYGIGRRLIDVSTSATKGGYPALGVYFADCPPVEHDLIAFDYRLCGPDGEPAIVHVDRDFDMRVSWLAADFATFARQLRPIGDFREPAGARQERTLSRVHNAPFGVLLQGLIDFYPDTLLPGRLRNLAAVIVQEKGCFALHEDAKSWLLYDVQFLLASNRLEVSSPAGYLHVYSTILARAGDDSFGADGYAPAFVEAWLRARIDQGWLEVTSVGIRFTAEAELSVLSALEPYQ